MSSSSSDRSHPPRERDRHGDGRGDPRHGLDRGEYENVGSDGDESRSVRGNDDYEANAGRQIGSRGQGGSHGTLGRGGEGSMGGIGGYGDAPDRGMYDGSTRSEGWGGRPGGMRQGDDPEPGSGMFGSPGSRVNQIGGGMGQGTHGQGGYGGMGQGTHGDARRGASQSGAERGPHSGRGPRGYRRSDALLSEEIHERLTEHPEIDASDVEIAVNDGEVTLTGVVSDRESKHLAEDVVAEVHGVREVMNHLRVRRLPGRA